MREAFRGPTGAAVYLAIVLGVAVLVALLSEDAAAYVVGVIPGIAVLVIVLALTRDGWTRSGWVALGITRFGFRVWPLAFLGPIAILAFVYGFLVFFDQIALTMLGGLRSPVETAARFPLALLVATLIGLCEEIGWRGYLLPRVVGRNPVAGMLLVGFCQGLVRVPMIVSMAIADAGGGGGLLGAAALVAALHLATFTAAGVFYGYLFLSTRSVWPTAIAYGTFGLLSTVGAQVVMPNSWVTWEIWGSEYGILACIGFVAAGLALLPRIRRLEISLPPRGISEPAVQQAPP